jgi:hypothetical protein
MLRATEQNISTDWPFHAGFEPAIAIKQHDEAPIFSTAVHGRRTHHDVAEADHATDMVDRNLELGLLLDLDLEGLMVDVKIGTFRSDIEGIEQLMHALSPGGMLKKFASGALASRKGSTYRRVRLASSLAAALLEGLFEYPVVIQIATPFGVFQPCCSHKLIFSAAC